MGKSSGDASTVTQVQPWSSQQPYLERAFGEALGVFEAPRQAFQGPTYTPFSAETETGIQALTEQAGRQNPLNQFVPGALGAGNVGQMYQQGLGGYSPEQGREFLQSGASDVSPWSQALLETTAAGGFLGSNPHLDGMFNEASRGVTDRFNESVMPGINATFGSSGRTGSGAHALTTGRAAGDLADTLGGMASNIYGSNFEAERGRQQAAAGALGNLGLSQRAQDLNVGSQALNLDAQARQRALQAAGGLGGFQLGAAGMAPTAQAMDLQNIQSLMQAGQLTEGKAKEIIADQMRLHEFGQNEPTQRLADYMSLIQGNYGQNSNATTDPGSNPLAGLLGGALVGNQLFGGLGGGNPWGAVGGGVLGGILGL